MLHGAMLVFSFESNLAFESQHLLHHLTSCGVKNWCSLTEGAHSELGWLTTASRKEAMALALREALRVGKISFSKNFFSISMTTQEARRRLLDEILNFSCITEPGKSAFARPRKTYTGKIGGLQDDTVIALQLVLIASKTFFENPKYNGFARQLIGGETRRTELPPNLM